MLATLREFFLLKHARARATAARAVPVATLRLRAAAQRRRQASAALVGADVAVGALVLDREALALEARARTSDEKTTDESALASLAAMIDAVEPTQRAPLRRAFDALTAPQPLAFDSMEPAKLAALRQDVAELLGWLDGEVELRSPRRLAIISVLRLAGLGLALAFFLRLTVGALLAPPNRALHKPVTASSRYPDTPDPQGFTDGDRNSLGVHTTVEAKAFVTVDLGLTYKVRTIKVYNRTECCLDESLPLIVEASVPNDPAPFVATREAHFDVWEIDVGGHPASTIKVRTGKSPGYVALSELEVVGDR